MNVAVWHVADIALHGHDMGIANDEVAAGGETIWRRSGLNVSRQGEHAECGGPAQKIAREIVDSSGMVILLNLRRHDHLDHIITKCCIESLWYLICRRELHPDFEFGPISGGTI